MGGFLRKIFIIIACMLITILWLGTTQSGLKTIVVATNIIARGTLVIDSAAGNFYNGIKLYNVHYYNKLADLNIKLLTIDIQSFKIIKTTNHILKFHGENLAIEPKIAYPIGEHLNLKQNIISNFFGNIYYNFKTLEINIESLSGIWQNSSLTGNICIKHTNKNLHIKSANITIADNTLHISTINNKQEDWQINLPAPEKIIPSIHGSIIAKGQIMLANEPFINGDIIINDFHLNKLHLNNLTTKFQFTLDPSMPLHITSSIKQIQYNDYILKNILIKTTGTGAKQDILLDLINPNQQINIQLYSEITSNSWKGTIQKFTLNATDWGFWQLKKPCHLMLNNEQASLDSFVLAADNIYSTLTFTGAIDKRKNQVTADLSANTTNISWLMRWFPDMTRLKGNFTSHTKINGNIDNPLITTNTNITNITMTFPAYGIKIKPLELHINGNSKDKIIITGAGNMRRGPGSFQISGFIDPTKPNVPHAIHIVGKDVEFINTDSYHLIANPDLTVTFKNINTMQIAGKLQILRGKVDLDNRDAMEVHRSKDVKFIVQQVKPAKPLTTIPIMTKNNDDGDFSIIPDLYVRIENKVRLKGLGLNSVISGKLKITKTEQFLHGEGRISTKKGYYTLSGQKLYVHYGKLYYPAGTLLTNPYLDIKISRNKPKKTDNQQKAVGYDDNKDCLYIQGTLNNPIIQDNGLIKNDQALAQVLNFGSGSVITKLQDKFKLTEFGITSEEINYDPMAQQSRNDTLLDNKNLIIGKKLTKKVYLQYSKGLVDTMPDTVHLKYLLNKNWAIGVETGTLGNGADLSFSLDKD